MINQFRRINVESQQSKTKKYLISSMIDCLIDVKKKHILKKLKERKKMKDPLTKHINNLLYKKNILIRMRRKKRTSDNHDVFFIQKTRKLLLCFNFIIFYV